MNINNYDDWKTYQEEKKGNMQCDICDAPMYEGDEYFEVNNVNYCESCMMEDFKKLVKGE